MIKCPGGPSPPLEPLPKKGRENEEKGKRQGKKGKIKRKKGKGREKSRSSVIWSGVPEGADDLSRVPVMEMLVLHP